MKEKRLNKGRVWIFESDYAQTTPWGPDLIIAFRFLLESSIGRSFGLQETCDGQISDWSPT